MGKSRCYSLMKCLLIIFNIIFLCMGIGICAVTSWALWEGGAAESAESRAGLAALAAWGGGVALGAAAVLAGCARGGPALAAGGALSALAAAAAAAALCWGAAHLPHLRRALLHRLERTLRDDYGVLPAHTQLLDSIQQTLECCGVSDMRDWQGSAWSEARAAEAARAGGAEPAAPGPLDLSVSAPPHYYWLPASCCTKESEAECVSSGGVSVGALGAGGAGAGVSAAGCGERVVEAVRGAAGGWVAAGGALLVLHAAAALLALLAAATAPTPHRHKA